MSVIRVGSNEKFAEGWDKIFSGPKKKTAKKTAAKKVTPKKAAKKKTAKKKK